MESRNEVHWPKSEGCQPVDFDREEVRRILQEGSRLEVEHVKVHRSKKEKQNMTSFERFVTGGKERADEMAKGCWVDEEMAQIRANSVQQRKEAVCAALQMRPCQRGATTPSLLKELFC